MGRSFAYHVPRRKWGWVGDVLRRGEDGEVLRTSHGFNVTAVLTHGRAMEVRIALVDAALGTLWV